MKKRWVILLVIISLVGGVFLSYLFRKTKTETVYINHTADSVFYQKQADSLAAIVVGLKNVSESKGKEIVRLRALLVSKRDSIKLMSPTETVKLFSQETGETTNIQSDSSVITSLRAITISNISFAEVRSLQQEVRCWGDVVYVKDSLIETQNALLTLKDSRITTLTDEYYKSQSAINSLNKVNKKRMTKNVILGVTTGVMVGFVVGVIVK